MTHSLKINKKNVIKVLSFVVIVVVGLILIIVFSSPKQIVGDDSFSSDAMNYQPKADVITKFKALCDQHQVYATYVSLGKSIMGNDIWAFRIGNPMFRCIMWDAQMHGSEDMGSEIEYMFAQWVLTNNSVRSNTILQRNYLVFIPVVNIDTYNRCNMRRTYTYTNGTTINITYGVNLNRNFVSGWGTNANYGSPDPTNNGDYRGPIAGSEPETQAMRNAFQTYRPMFYVNTHMWGGPWLGYHGGNVTYHYLVRDRIAQISSEMGVTPYNFIACGTGGFAVADAKYFGANAYLIEFQGSGTPTLIETRTIYYPKCVPIFLAMCEFGETVVIPEYSMQGLLALFVISTLSIAVITKKTGGR